MMAWIMQHSSNWSSQKHITVGTKNPSFMIIHEPCCQFHEKLSASLGLWGAGTTTLFFRPHMNTSLLCRWRSQTPVSICRHQQQGCYSIIALSMHRLLQWCNRLSALLMAKECYLGGDLHRELCHDIEFWVICRVCGLCWLHAGNFWKAPCI